MDDKITLSISDAVDKLIAHPFYRGGQIKYSLQKTCKESALYSGKIQDSRRNFTVDEYSVWQLS